MKKLSLFIPLAIATFLLCACGKKTTDKNYIDYNNMFAEEAGPAAMTCNDKGYYFAMNNMLCYADKDKMKVVPVCAKIDCDHRFSSLSAMPSSCDSYIGSPEGWFGNIQYYDGKLYIVTDMTGSDQRYSLWEMSTDGTERRELIRLKGVSQVAIHRGHVYYYEKEYNVDDNTQLLKVYQCDLSGKNKKVIYETNENIESVTFHPYRNNIYMLVGHEIIIYNAESNKLKTAEKPKEATTISYQFMDDKLVFRYWYEYGDERNAQVYTSDLDFSNPQPFITLTSPYNKIGCDGKYLYEDNYMDRDVYRENIKTRQIIIYDLEGKKLDTVDLGDTGTYCNGYGDEKYFFLRVDDAIYCFDKSEIGSGNIKVTTLRERS